MVALSRNYGGARYRVRFIHGICDWTRYSSAAHERLSVHAADMAGSIADVTGGQPLESCGSRSASDISAALMSAARTRSPQSAAPIDNHHDKSRE